MLVAALQHAVHIHGQRCRLMHGESIGVGSHLTVGQHWQESLLAVGKIGSTHTDTAHEEVGSAIGDKGKPHGCGGILFNREITFVNENHLLCHRIHQLYGRHTRLRLVTYVGHPCRNGGLVAHSQETWHIGLHHHLFLRDSRAVHCSHVHVKVVGHTQKSPCGDALGQFELDGQ